MRANFIIPSTVIIKRSSILAAGLFDQNLRSCEDWDLWLRLLPEHEFVGSNKCLVRYRLHGKSLSTNLGKMHQSAQSVIQKNFGKDDGQPQQWSSEKRRAYGGLYRYQALTSIQRQDNWQAASQYLIQGINVDPTLVTDLDLFYDLALGSQPAGLRGSGQQLELSTNAEQVHNMLAGIFKTSESLRKFRNSAYGTAYYALGLVAYNLNQLRYSRKYLIKAVFYRPKLIFDLRLVGDLVKSSLNPAIIKKLKPLTGKRKKSVSL